MYPYSSDAGNNVVSTYGTTESGGAAAVLVIGLVVVLISVVGVVPFVRGTVPAGAVGVVVVGTACFCCFTCC